MSGSRGELPPLVDYLVVPAVNLTLAFLVSGLVVLAIGENPLAAVRIMLSGALGYAEGVGYTLYYTTNFIFTGLAVAVAFHAGLFNIGAEGQATMAGLGVAIVCLAFDGAPWWLVLPFAVAAAALFGAGWAFVPGWAQARRGSHIVITTIMFNFIAATVMVYLLVNVLGKPGAMNPETRTFAEATRLPPIRDMLLPLGFDVGTSPLNPSFFLACLAALLVWLLIWHSRLGYEMRVFGFNPTAAVYAGIDPARVVMIAMMISGALAGLLAVNEVMGVQNRLLLEFVGGAGFVGIAVALMGRAHPLGIVLAAFLFGVLYQGGAELSFERPKISRDMVVVIQGLVILFAGALEHLSRPTLVRLFRRTRLAAEA
ncbi:sugar ABC transporter permease [Prosthecomicrobium hirschii]|uniref:ABC transporter permease n=1 Tax=Prosthecodimorpha hirschii TaxID=665126 RepID=UPI001129F81E|nr:ABC transporter permease [Prosthecomicrobium hirschii]TPQ51640.1 sugar ABC transporter permease [Prosthecomicrobium hirschii]